MGADAVNKRCVAGGRASLDIEIDAGISTMSGVNGSGVREGSLPVEHRVAKGANRAAAAEEQVPYGVRKRLSLAVRREAHRTRGASEAHGHDLALGLTGLDVGSDRRTVGQVRAGERRIVRRVADLGRRATCPTVSFENNIRG